jgi:hypothetical protein
MTTLAFKNPGTPHRLPCSRSPINNPGAKLSHTLSLEEGQNQKRTGRPVENDVTVEILKNRIPWIPTATCKSLRKERFGFRTFSTGPAAIHYCLTRRETLMTRAKMRFLFDRSHPLRK